MKKICKISLLLIFLISNSCGGKKEETSVIKETSLELQMIALYKEGMNALVNDGDVIFAAKKFNEAELVYPQSEWASKSALMAAYSYYSQNYFSDAIFELERFIKVYPNHPNTLYAHFLLAMCYYESIVDEKKDLKPLLKAKNKFTFIVNNYPQTDFALDAKFKIDLINEYLASKEMYIGRHYMKKGKWIPAINRFKNVINNYDTTIYTQEALHRLVEIHYKIGLIDEAKKYANTLGYNYLSSEWYKKSYKVFNTKYKSETKIAKKKKGNFIIKKFKSLFE